MKETIRIRPKHSTNITLQGVYAHKELKRNVYLTRGGDVIKDRELLVTEKVNSVSFTSANKEHVIEWDGDDSTPQGKSNKGKFQAVKWFYENHPHMEIVGGNNKFIQQDLFTLENINDITAGWVNEIKEKIRIGNLIQSYDLKTQRDVCFAFGGNPEGMSQNEIFVDLLHPERGRVIVNWSEFEKRWNPALNKDIEYIVIAKKAVAFGIIETRNNNYMIGQEIVGAGDNFDSVIGYLKNSAGRFDYVRHEVQLRDMPKEIKKSAMPDDSDSKVSDKLIELREEAKNLGIKKWQIKREAQLEAEIANAKLVKGQKGPVAIVSAGKAKELSDKE